MSGPEEKLDAFGAKIAILPQRERHVVTATPFEWHDPETIPTRRFLWASRHSIAFHVGLTGAFGGGGKSSLSVCECLSHVTGKNLLDDPPLFRGKAWYLGLEDPMEEHTRRVVAAALLHKIQPQEFAGRLFLNDATQDFVIARDSRDGVTIAEPVVDGIIQQIGAKSITYLVVDPFVASHGVTENDNGAIDTVARIWVRIARETGCAIDLVHHLRKGNGTGSTEPGADDFRGASALIPAVRSARLLAPMTADEAERHGVENPYSVFRVIDAKRNMAPRASDRVWRQLTAIDLRNGNGGPSDRVAAVEPWRLPDASSIATVGQLEEIKAVIWVGFGVPIFAQKIGLAT